MPQGKALVKTSARSDIYLIDAEGYVVYSLNKELDFSTNVRTGPGRNSGLGDAFFAAWYADSSSGADLDARVMLTDFAPYDAVMDRNAEAAAKYASKFPAIKLASINDFGGWTKAQAAHFADGGVFDQIYKG